MINYVNVQFLCINSLHKRIGMVKLVPKINILVPTPGLCQYYDAMVVKPGAQLVAV